MSREDIQAKINELINDADCIISEEERDIKLRIIFGENIDEVRLGKLNLIIERLKQNSLNLDITVLYPKDDPLVKMFAKQMEASVIEVEKLLNEI